MSITITIPLGLLQAPGKLRNNAITPAQITRILRRLGPLLVGQFKLTFRDSRDPYGEPRAPLAKSTIANRKHGGDRPPEDTGAHDIAEERQSTGVRYWRRQDCSQKRQAFGQQDTAPGLPTG